MLDSSKKISIQGRVLASTLMARSIRGASKIIRNMEKAGLSTLARRTKLSLRMANRRKY